MKLKEKIRENISEDTKDRWVTFFVVVFIAFTLVNAYLTNLILIGIGMFLLLVVLLIDRYFLFDIYDTEN